MLYNVYRSRARTAGLAFLVSLEDVIEVSQKDCAYCGAAPAQVIFNRNCSEAATENSKFIYNGIDRLDSSRGYERDNIVPCCGYCNRAKMAMSVDEFRHWVKRVYTHWASKE